MKGLRSITSAAILAALVACATPYQPTGTAGGYYHKVIAENTYLVGFSGNGYTARSTARDFALLRAAEIGKQLGYDHMVVLGTEDLGRTENAKFGAPTATTYGTVTGNRYSGTTTYNSNEVPVFKPKVEISVLYSEGYPQGRHLEVFQISNVIQSLKAKHSISDASNRPRNDATTHPKTNSVNLDTALSTTISPSAVKFSQKANWFPNQYGYKGLSIRSVPPEPTPGTLVVTPGAVLFMVWNDSRSRLVTAKIIARERLQEATIDKYGLGRRLVLVTDNEANSFELLGGLGIMVDRSATKDVASLLANSGN